MRVAVIVATDAVFAATPVIVARIVAPLAPLKETLPLAVAVPAHV